MEKPADVRDALQQARKAVAKCKAVGDRFTLNKMYTVAPQVAARYSERLKEMIDAATEDEDRQALAQYVTVSRELEDLLTALGKELGAK